MNAQNREIFDERQPFLPGGETEAGEFTFRFREPSSFLKNLAKKVTAELMDLAEPDAFFIPKNLFSPVPARWQPIFDELYRQKITTSPEAVLEEPFNDEPKLFLAHLLPYFEQADTDGHQPLQVYSRGASLFFEEALSKAIGELLERYALSRYKNRALIKASPGSLKKKSIPHLDPAGLAAFSEKQLTAFPSRQWNESSSFFWVEGRELGTAYPVLLPAQLVFWNYCTHTDGEEPYLWQPLTNGAAGHFSPEEALISGIYELVQRDAFLIHWLNRLAPPRVDISTAQNQKIRALYRLCRRYRLEVIVLNTTTDIPLPSFVAAIMDQTGQGPALAMGGGCDLDPEKAIIQSVTEALGVRHWLRRRGKAGTKEAAFPLSPSYQPFKEEIGQEGRLLLWGRREMLPYFAFFLEGQTQPLSAIPMRTFSAPPKELECLQKIIGSLGPEYRIYFYKAQHTVLDALGYCALRVIIPPLLPLYLNENAATLGAGRLKTALAKLGKKPAASLNPLPHPFP